MKLIRDTCPLVAKVEIFDVRNRQDFFTSSERSFLVHDILASPRKNDDDDVDDECRQTDGCVADGRTEEADRNVVEDTLLAASTEPIHRLVKQGVYVDAFPLHDGSLNGDWPLLFR